VIAADVLYYQNADGGWPKNIDIIARTSPLDRSTIDNSATTTELVYLSLMYRATSNPVYLAAFNKGLDYLLAAQYPGNGGWPQIYPSPTSAYQKHITFNDGAMIHVLSLLRDIVNRAIHTQYAFVDDTRAGQAATALQAGIDCILKTQIVVDGVKTGWCAQYDEVTLQPANARAYELISNSGSEGAGVLQFLMEIDQPTPAIVEAVQAATAWFNKVQILGLRVESIVDTTQASGKDTVATPDPTAPPVWARFYEIGTDRPFFCGRDGVKKYTLAEIENERRVGYAWYGDWPAARLRTYASWQPIWAASQNVLLTPPPAADGGGGGTPEEGTPPPPGDDAGAPAEDAADASD
jgi:PelA/Pel-15E family pectate lyase